MAEHLLKNAHRLQEYAIETETVPDLDSLPQQPINQVKPVNRPHFYSTGASNNVVLFSSEFSQNSTLVFLAHVCQSLS